MATPKPKFTKGPWVYKWFGGPQIGGGRDGATAICTLWGSWRTGKPSPQERANCSLICAAPDYFAAVEIMEGADLPEDEQWREGLAMLRAAHARARGAA